MVLAARDHPLKGCMEGESTMRLTRLSIKCATLLLPLAMTTASLAFGPPYLSDPQQPGSVIIFPKFINMPPVTVDGELAPRTEIEIGAVCPVAGIGAAATDCPEHMPVKVQFHWVCPGAQNTNSNICRGTDFDVVLSVNGKLAFSSDGTPINSNSPFFPSSVPAAPCPRGYLIGNAVAAATDAPVKFDGLIGSAVIRGPNLTAGPNAGTSLAVSAYNAITIQAANPSQPNYPGSGDPGASAIDTPIDPLTGTGTLAFNGAPVAPDSPALNHYTEITGQFFGNVRFDKIAAGGPLPNVLSQTFLILLTLDVRTNLPNLATYVPLLFYNESFGGGSTTNPNFERLTSTSWAFVCWDQIQLSTIDTNLTQAFQGTRQGTVIAGPAVKVPEDGIFDPVYNPPSLSGGPVTLIGLIETIEGTAANGFQERKYNFNTTNDGAPIRTRFVPFPFD